MNSNFQNPFAMNGNEQKISEQTINEMTEGIKGNGEILNKIYEEIKKLSESLSNSETKTFNNDTNEKIELPTQDNSVVNETIPMVEPSVTSEEQIPEVPAMNIPLPVESNDNIDIPTVSEENINEDNFTPIEDLLKVADNNEENKVVVPDIQITPVIENTTPVETPAVSEEPVSIPDVESTPVVENVTPVETPAVSEEPVIVPDIQITPVIENTASVETPLVSEEPVSIPEVQSAPVVENVTSVETPLVSKEPVSIPEVQSAPVVENVTPVETPAVSKEPVVTPEVQSTPVAENVVPIETPAVSVEPVVTPEVQSAPVVENVKDYEVLSDIDIQEASAMTGKQRSVVLPEPDHNRIMGKQNVNTLTFKQAA